MLSTCRLRLVICAVTLKKQEKDKFVRARNETDISFFTFKSNRSSSFGENTEDSSTYSISVVPYFSRLFSKSSVNPIHVVYFMLPAQIPFTNPHQYCFNGYCYIFLALRDPVSLSALCQEVPRLLSFFLSTCNCEFSVEAPLGLGYHFLYGSHTIS